MNAISHAERREAGRFSGFEAQNTDFRIRTEDSKTAPSFSRAQVRSQNQTPKSDDGSPKSDHTRDEGPGPSKSATGAPKLTNYRQSESDMQSALNHYLDQPCQRIYLVGLLHKLEQSARAGQLGMNTQDLCGTVSQDIYELRSQIQALLSCATEDGLITKTGQETRTSCAAYTLRDKGQRFLSLAKQTRIALWKVNPRMDILQICAILELEENDASDLYLNAVTTIECQAATPRRSMPTNGNANPLWSATLVWAKHS